MGCGSSTLKGEKVEDIKAEQPQPIKKVRTNFSEVDFAGESNPARRGTVALAPDEQRRATKASEASEDPISTIREEEPTEPQQQSQVLASEPVLAAEPSKDANLTSEGSGVVGGGSPLPATVS